MSRGRTMWDKGDVFQIDLVDDDDDDEAKPARNSHHAVIRPSMVVDDVPPPPTFPARPPTKIIRRRLSNSSMRVDANSIKWMKSAERTQTDHVGNGFASIKKEVESSISSSSSSSRSSSSRGGEEKEQQRDHAVRSEQDNDGILMTKPAPVDVWNDMDDDNDYFAVVVDGGNDEDYGNNNNNNNNATIVSIYGDNHKYQDDEDLEDVVDVDDDDDEFQLHAEPGSQESDDTSSKRSRSRGSSVHGFQGDSQKRLKREDSGKAKPLTLLTFLDTASRGIDLGYQTPPHVGELHPEELEFWQAWKDLQGILMEGRAPRYLERWRLHVMMIDFVLENMPSDGGLEPSEDHQFWQDFVAKTQVRGTCNVKQVCNFWRSLARKPQVQALLPAHLHLREEQQQRQQVEQKKGEEKPRKQQQQQQQQQKKGWESSQGEPIDVTSTRPAKRLAWFLPDSSQALAPGQSDERQRPHNWNPSTNPETPNDAFFTQDLCSYSDSIFVQRGLKYWEQYAFTCENCFDALELFDLPENHPAYPGRGVRASYALEKDQILGSYAGVLMLDMFIAHDNRYTFKVGSVKKAGSSGQPKGDTRGSLSIDAKTFGNITRFINGSIGNKPGPVNVVCQRYMLPLERTRQGGGGEEEDAQEGEEEELEMIPCVLFRVACDIEAGEELLLDYGKDFDFRESFHVKQLREHRDNWETKAKKLESAQHRILQDNAILSAENAKLRQELAKANSNNKK